MLHRYQLPVHLAVLPSHPPRFLPVAWSGPGKGLAGERTGGVGNGRVPAILGGPWGMSEGPSSNFAELRSPNFKQSIAYVLIKLELLPGLATFSYVYVVIFLIPLGFEHGRFSICRGHVDPRFPPHTTDQALGGCHCKFAILVTEVSSHLVMPW